MNFEKIKAKIDDKNSVLRDDIGYNVLLSILDFLKKNHAVRVAIFLHTSAVAIRKHNLDILKGMESRRVKFYIPENCVHELKLLQERSSIMVLRNKAKNLLDLFGNSISWSHYEMIGKRTSVSSYYKYDKALFVFCEPAAASEFSKNFYHGFKNYILSYNPYSVGKDSNLLCKVGDNVTRPCKAIRNNGALINIEKKRIPLSIMSFDDKKIQDIDFASLKYFSNGSEAELYESPFLPGKLIKIYYRYPSEEKVQKLKWISMTFDENYKCCATPINKICCGDKCIGFVMNKVDGDTLLRKTKECLANNDKKKTKELLLNFSASFLETRINQLIVADLSPNNAIVKKDGRVVFIDVDSMEFGRFPGGSVTNPYGHPGFDLEKDPYQRLRTLEESSFSYAVMLFWFLMGEDCQNPLFQCGVDESEGNWKDHKFPYANSLFGGSVAQGVKVDKSYLKRWKRQPNDVRTGFVDIFANHKTYDIGEWLKILNLI